MGLGGFLGIWDLCDKSGFKGPNLREVPVSLKKSVKIKTKCKDFNYDKVNNIVNILILKNIYIVNNLLLVCVWHKLFLPIYFTIQLIFTIIHGSYCTF